MNRTLMTPLLSAMALGGCASALRLENVTGSWTCPRVDGVCAEISEIDAGLMANGVDGSATAFSGASAPGFGVTPSGAPMRTGDEVAKIVLAPMIDANGYYLGSREIYAVMRAGGWAPPSPKADSRSQEPVHNPEIPEESDER